MVAVMAFLKKEPKMIQDMKNMVADKSQAAALDILADNIKNAENIEEVTNVGVEEVYGDNSGVLGLKVKCNKSGEIRDLPTPGVFVFVGRNVLNAPLKQADGTFLCDVIESGEVVVDLKMRTTTKGLSKLKSAR